MDPFPNKVDDRHLRNSRLECNRRRPHRKCGAAPPSDRPFGNLDNQPANESTQAVKLSVVIPCFNRRNTIARIVSAVRSAPVSDLEIVLVGDLSADGTGELIESHLQGMVDVVRYHDTNQGKGAALRTGFSSASGDKRSSVMATSKQNFSP